MVNLSHYFLLILRHDLKRGWCVINRYGKDKVRKGELHSMPHFKNQNGDGDSTRLNTSFYEKDKFHTPGRFVQRKFRDPLHFLHNLFDLFTYTPDLFRVYLGRAISPGFREMIMLTVASSNDCDF